MIRCKRCNRVLTQEKFIKLGYGSSCAKKEGIIKTIPRKLKIIRESKKLTEWI